MIRGFSCVAWLLVNGSLLAAGEQVSFRAAIAPVLTVNCLGCHNRATAEGGYRVDSFAELTQPGDSERAPVVAGEPERSELFRRLTTADEGERMPAEGDPLDGETMALVRRWIQQGATYDASDPKADLSSILPITRHPDPPREYRHPLPVTAICFDRGGKQLLIGGYHELFRWDLDEAALVERIPQVGERVHGILVDADAGHLYVASGTPGQLGEVRFLDAETGALLAVPLVTSETVLDLALHPTRALLAAAGADRRIHLIDLATGRARRTIESHSDWVHSVEWNQDGSRLVSASRDKTTKVFELPSERLVGNYTGHESSVADACFVAGGGDRVISCDSGGEVHLWNVADGKRIRRAPARGQQAFRILSAPDGFWLASADHKVRQYDWSARQERRAYGNHADQVLCIAVSDANDLLATGSLDGSVRVWSLKDGFLKARFVPSRME